MQRAPAGGGLFIACIVAVERIGRNAEHVFHGERHARGDVIFQLAERDHDVGVHVTVIHVKRGKHQAAGRNFDVRIGFAAAEIAGVFVLHIAQRAQRLHIPSGQFKCALERSAALRRFNEHYPFRAGFEQRRSQGLRRRFMRHVSLAHRPIQKRREVGAREIDFDRDGLSLHERANPAQQIKALTVSGVDFLRPVGFARGDGDLRIGE